MQVADNPRSRLPVLTDLCSIITAHVSQRTSLGVMSRSGGVGWWVLPADSDIASEATAALAKLRMSGHVKATQLAAQRAALDASADTEGDGHEAAAQEALGLQVHL